MIDVPATIPHRPPFLFLDSVSELTETRIVGSRTFHAEEPFYAGHYPGNPITPGVLLCEACFQTGAVFLVKRMEKVGQTAAGLTPVLSRIGEARFKQMVKPGDTITIEVEFKETVSIFHFLRGKIVKDGKVAMTIDFALALVDEKARP